MHPAAIPFPARKPTQRVRTIAVQAEIMDDGRLRISSPHARGWAATAATPMELAHVMRQAFTEVTCASYALAKGEPYDLDRMTTHVPGDALAANPQRRVRNGRPVRRKSHDPMLWTKYEDGSWRSPAGRTYGAETRAVQNVIKRRQEKGLPT
jgi:hypothetical protein